MPNIQISTTNNQNLFQNNHPQYYQNNMFQYHKNNNINYNQFRMNQNNMPNLSQAYFYNNQYNQNPNMNNNQYYNNYPNNQNFKMGNNSIKKQFISYLVKDDLVNVRNMLESSQYSKILIPDDYINKEGTFTALNICSTCGSIKCAEYLIQKKWTIMFQEKEKKKYFFNVSM